MRAIISPSGLSGHVQAPASKSSMQRACAAALLVKGNTVIKKIGHSDDENTAIKVIEALGAWVEDEGTELEIDSTNAEPVTRDINFHESGLSIRMFIPIIALTNKKITIKSEGSLKKRPLEFFDTVLPQLGVKIKSNKGKTPLVIQGPLIPADIEVDGSLSSQFLTGLLMAYSAAGANGVSIKVKDLKSKPYIDLTLDIMKRFGMKLPENRNYKEFFFSAEKQGSRLRNQEYIVESDWSGGAFLLVAGAIAGSITVRGLDLTSTQADKAIVDVLMSVKAGIAMEAKGIKIRPVEMSAFAFDATDCPDLFPPLVALAAYCKGTSKLKGVSRLTHKESDRAMALQTEFGKMGIRIEIEKDMMMIYGGNQVKGAIVDSHNDHRIAMALAVAALKAKGDTVISNAEAVNKSYPDFFEDLKKLGADVSLNNKIRLHE